MYAPGMLPGVGGAIIKTFRKPSRSGRRLTIAQLLVHDAGPLEKRLGPCCCCGPGYRLVDLFLFLKGGVPRSLQGIIAAPEFLIFPLEIYGYR